MKPIFEAIHKCSEAIEKGKAKDVQKYLEQIQTLIKKDKTVLDLADNDSKEPLKGDYPIHRACRLSRGQIVDVLLGLGDNVNRIKSTSGATPLHLATANNDLGMVNLLLNAGAKVNAVTSNSLESTPLVYALAKNFILVAQRLIEKGADVSKIDKESGNPYYFIAIKLAHEDARYHQMACLLSNAMISEKEKIINEKLASAKISFEKIMKGAEGAEATIALLKENIGNGLSAQSIKKVLAADQEIIKYFKAVKEKCLEWAKNLIDGCYDQTQKPRLQKRKAEIEQEFDGYIKALNNHIRDCEQLQAQQVKAPASTVFFDSLQSSKGQANNYVQPALSDLEKIKRELDEARVELKVLMMNYESLEKEESIGDKKELEDLKRANRLISVLSIKNEIEDIIIKSDQFGVSKEERDKLVKIYIDKLDKISEDKNILTQQDLDCLYSLLSDVFNVIKTKVPSAMKERFEESRMQRMESINVKLKQYATQEATVEGNLLLNEKRLVGMGKELANLKGQIAKLESQLSVVSNSESKQGQRLQAKLN